MLMEEERDIVITSCCHSVNLLIQKYYPAMLEYLFRGYARLENEGGRYPLKDVTVAGGPGRDYV